MNAPASPATVAPQSLQQIALASLVPSKTHLQELRRARFTKEALAELAASIAKVGILQAIVARPLAGSGSKFEIVAGERRYLAAKQAGLPAAPVNVRELSDDEVLEVQLIENLQREGLHELEEAEGYEELMKLKKISADAVADMVGRSRSYVFKRTKLLALCPEARKAFYAGDMDASTALLIARIPGAELQKKAMADLKEQREYGDIANFKDAQDFIHEQYMLQLKVAPFDTKDATLVPKAGSCMACPKRTGNQRDLFGDVKSGDVCTDPSCFAEKRKAGEAKMLAEYKAKGVEVIVGEAAKRVLPYSDSYASHGYHLAGEKNWNDSKGRKYGQLVEPGDVKLVQSPHSGNMIKVVHSSALKAGKPPARRKMGNHGAKLDEEAGRKVVELLAAKYSGPLGRDDLLALAHIAAEHAEVDEDWFRTLFKIPTTGRITKHLPKLSEKELGRYLVLQEAANDLLAGYGRPGISTALCKRLKVDPKRVRKDLEAAKKAEASAKAKKK